jgi:GAF domain-containing protein
LDLEEGLPIILKGILEETQAATARFVLLGGRNYPRQVFSAGLSHAVFPGLDRALVSALYRRREPLISQNLQQQDITPLLEGPLQSVAAFPVRTHDRTVAVLWVGSEKAHAFDEARLNFLTTLVSQAAVLVENARLFQAAEGGRQRLSAILSSTTDAILVTDQEQRLLLINPAAQRIFKLDELAYGRSISQLDLPTALEEALVEPFPEQQTAWRASRRRRTWILWGALSSCGTSRISRSWTR